MNLLCWQCIGSPSLTTTSHNIQWTHPFTCCYICSIGRACHTGRQELGISGTFSESRSSAQQFKNIVANSFIAASKKKDYWTDHQSNDSLTGCFRDETLYSSQYNGAFHFQISVLLWLWPMWSFLTSEASIVQSSTIMNKSLCSSCYIVEDFCRCYCCSSSQDRRTVCSRIQNCCFVLPT